MNAHAGSLTSASQALDITGMTCAACAGRVEKALAQVPGVTHAHVNLALERADVEGSAATPALIEAVEKTGYGALARGNSANERRKAAETLEARHRADNRRTLLLFALAVLLTLPFLAGMAAMALGLPDPLSPILQLVLATIVQFTAGLRFYRGAWKALRGGAANMDVLVALGTSAAWGFSAWTVLADGRMAHGHLYFEGATVVITLVLLGKVLESRAKAGASEAVRALFALRAQTARRLVGETATDVPIDDLAAGDLFAVRPGERIAADGIVVAGQSEADEALVTGESVPVAKTEGARVVEGSLNGSGALTIRASAVGEDTTLARIARLVEAAQTGQAPIQRLVDRIVGLFVPAVIAIAAVTFLGWLAVGGGFEQALVAAVSVLVVACPCALGLATPVTLVAGTGAAAKAGILVRDIETLERARDIDMVAFDKTGTLTEGRMRVAEVRPLAGETGLLALAAAVNAPSEHPVGRAIVEAAKHRALHQETSPDGVSTQAPPLPPISAFRSFPGEGVGGEVGGRRVVAGNAALMAREGIDVSALAADRATLEAAGRTAIMVAAGGRALGVIGIADTIRPEAAEAVARLRQQGAGIRMLSGDAETVAASVAKALSLDGFEAPVKPADKAAAIIAMRRAGRHVAMVGDGVNDAPALAAADVGIAMGSGTDAAAAAAGLILMRPDPRLVPAALDIARATANKIRQNLFLAFVYNVVAIPLAAFGLLSPAIAGAAMALSSVSVVSNALLLKRWRADLR